MATAQWSLRLRLLRRSLGATLRAALLSQSVDRPPSASGPRDPPPVSRLRIRALPPAGSPSCAGCAAEAFRLCSACSAGRAGGLRILHPQRAFRMVHRRFCGFDSVLCDGASHEAVTALLCRALPESVMVLERFGGAASCCPSRYLLRPRVSNRVRLFLLPGPSALIAQTDWSVWPASRA